MYIQRPISDTHSVSLSLRRRKHEAHSHNAPRGDPPLRVEALQYAHQVVVLPERIQGTGVYFVVHMGISGIVKLVYLHGDRAVLIGALIDS